MKCVFNLKERQLDVDDPEQLFQLLLFEQEEARSEPVIAFVSLLDDSCLSIGLGRERSSLVYIPSEGWPSRHAVDSHAGKGFIDYQLGGQFSEFPLIQSVRIEDAIEACVEFASTGKLSEKLEWEDD